MITGLDHVALAVRDLPAAAEAYRRMLGRAPAPPVVAEGVARVRFQLDNMALELVSPADEAPTALKAQLDSVGEGLWAQGFSAEDPAAERRLLTRRGLGEDAAGLRIELAPRAHAAPAPALSDPQACVAALDHVVVQTPNADRALALYGARLGLDLRLDRSNPDWGVRQLFFRCGGAVVEFAASLKTPVSDDPDRFGGLAWRVPDADAARTRLLAAGFDVSEVRKGRKPGTRVLTVRSGVPAGPALLIQQNASEEAE